MGKIIRNGINYGGTYEDATSVNYDGSNSGLNAHTVQEGIDKVVESLAYSTEEKIVGTWIDGKPLYRKVITYNSANISNTRQDIVLFTQPNLEITNMRGVFKWSDSSQTLTIPCYYNMDTTQSQMIIDCYYRTQTSEFILRLYNGAGSVVGNDFMIVIEYTKTTD